VKHVTRRAAAPLLALALLAACSPGTTTPLAGATSAAPSVAPTVTTTASTPPASTPPQKLAVQTLGTFSSPVWVGPAPGDATHLYLVEKTGRVLQLDANGNRLGVVLDLTGQVSKGNEQGLLSIAFDPAYATNHRMYADFTDLSGNVKVVAYIVTGGVAGQSQQLLSVDQPFTNHNGGLVLFDRTGMLLVGLGDGGSAGDPGNLAQDLRSDQGKILRLDPKTGLGAPGNPYKQNPKVWALGLRDPWRFSFDTNGDFYLGDIGQNKVEELDVVPPAYQSGANYGWSVDEGNELFKKDQQLTPGGPVISPALTYLHTDDGCSITGGEVYRGTALPLLGGNYIFGDYCQGKLLAVTRTATGVSPVRLLGVQIDGLQAFGHDTNGELLVLSANKLLRLVLG
jgi:glucose/arabinose dehydrogenase